MPGPMVEGQGHTAADEVAAGCRRTGLPQSEHECLKVLIELFSREGNFSDRNMNVRGLIQGGIQFGLP